MSRKTRKYAKNDHKMTQKLIFFIIFLIFLYFSCQMMSFGSDQNTGLEVSSQPDFRSVFTFVNSISTIKKHHLTNENQPWGHLWPHGWFSLVKWCFLKHGEKWQIWKLTENPAALDTSISVVFPTYRGFPIVRTLNSSKKKDVLLRGYTDNKVLFSGAARTRSSRKKDLIVSVAPK